MRGHMSAVCTVFLAGSLEAEPQYPDVFFTLPRERTEMEVGNGRGRGEGWTSERQADGEQR